MPREASSKRPPHPARLCLTAPAGPTSPAEGRCDKARGAAIQAITLRYRKRRIAAQRVISYEGKSRIATILPRASAVIRQDRIGRTIFWAVTFYDAAGNRLLNRLCRSRYRAERYRDRLIAACVEIAQQRQRPGEIGGQIGGEVGSQSAGKPVKGRQAIKREKRASRHVAKVAPARAGRN